MLGYTLKRLLSAIPTLLVIITLAFALLHAAPGGPFDEEKALPPEVKANIERAYHLDESLPRQYIRYLGQILHGDLGPSYQYRDTTVTELVAQGFPVDFTIGVIALVLALLIGIPIGVWAAVKQNTAQDYVPMAVAMLGISLPVFIVAPVLILIFAVLLHWLPAGGWAGGAPSHIVLPAVSMALPFAAYLARLMRGSLVDVLGSPFIRTARAKGLPTRTVVWVHALKPALMPIVSFLGPAVVGIISGSIVIETIFGLPGMGRYFVDGALNRDYTVVLGVTVLYGVMIVVANLVADLCYAALDPRIRYQ
ncbi:MAG: oligopeptide ABC transporter permease OppB [Nevskiaceae bacterium]|nr:MAG: oligopeptide ABC transporter permease OppB [Nevskiaceae bacterium]TBR72069.1 MAG: oligopeptide ABC transporter permease OppB [Nevskiaceae bacterium]